MSRLTHVSILHQGFSTVRILDDDCEFHPRPVVLCSVLLIFIHADTITFEQPEYIISEDVGSLEACVKVIGSFSQPLLLKLYTVQDTATGMDNYCEGINCIDKLI